MADLVVSDVTKAFGEKTVLQDVSIRIQDHELVSLLGVSGGGKTTLFNVISGLLTPDRGQVLLDGEDITGIPGKVSYMLQKDLLLPYRTVEDNVALPLVIGGMKKKEARQKVAPYFEEFGLLGTEKKYPEVWLDGMSGGSNGDIWSDHGLASHINMSVIYQSQVEVGIDMISEVSANLLFCLGIRINPFHSGIIKMDV